MQHLSDNHLALYTGWIVDMLLRAQAIFVPHCSIIKSLEGDLRDLRTEARRRENRAWDA